MPRSIVLLLATVCLLGCASGAPELPAVSAIAELSPKVPVVLVPGITGSELLDTRTGELVWGLGRHIVTPKDGGYAMARPLTDPVDGPAGDVEAGDILRTIRLGPITKAVYEPVPNLLAAHGWVPGDLRHPTAEADLYTFAYDWRGDNIHAARVLRERLEALADTRGNDPLEVDLICQSNGAHICRYLLKYGAASLADAEAGRARPSDRFRIRKLVLVGTSNGGAMRILREIHRGRKYLPLVGRTMHPEVPFTFPAVYQDLPAHLEHPFVDPEGRPLDIDLFDPESWIENGWSVFRPEPRARMAERPDLFGTEDDRRAFLGTALDRARRFHRLLARDVPHFGDTRYYSLQNGYTPTPHLAVVGAGKDGLLFTGDPELAERPYLAALITHPGDGHATVAGQKSLSPQELDALAHPPYLVQGGHFELILEPGTLRRLLDFFGEP